jgi:multidrug transporter EmrE-like cation transporter
MRRTPSRGIRLMLAAVAMLSLFVYSLKTLPLTGAYAIFLCAPLIVTALS